MCKKHIICLFLIWHALGPIKTFISACVRAYVRARACVCAKMRVSVRERERERERGWAIHVLFIHSVFFVAFILFFFFFTLRTVYVFWISYKFDVISSNAKDVWSE